MPRPQSNRPAGHRPGDRPGPLAGQTAVVTGASSGIGRAIALELAGRGANLVVTAHQNAAGLAEVKLEAEARGVRVATHLADLAEAAACERLVEAAWSAGPIDLWIHNAGADVLTGEAAGGSFEEKLDRLWRVDVRGTITCCRAAGERMRRRGSGAVLTVGWDQAETGMEGDAGQMFGAAKGAVIAFTKALAKTLAPAVRVNCLAPGWVRTKWGEDAPERWRQRAVAESLVGRWGEPADVAAAAAFLASPEASFITGQVLPINGGFAGSRRPSGEA